MRHALLVGAVVVTGSALIPAGPALAAPTETVIVGDVITLVSISDPATMDDLQPGVPVQWQVGVSAHPADPGVVDLSLAGSGALVSDPSGLWVSVDTCEVRWVGSTCASGHRSVMALAAASSTSIATSVPLGSMHSDEELWVMVNAVLPSAPLMRAGTATLSLIASGSGDVVSVGTTPGALAATGADITGPVRAALAAITTGLVLAFAARLRRRQRRLA